jgi:ADP-heptose:LPS heptosyltransferase
LFHKESGIACPECFHYAPVKEKILIIKLDAMGDVLRTTALLPPLKRKYPESTVTWLTLSPSVDFFVGNTLVNEVVDFRVDALPRILSEAYELVINPDTNKLSASLATLARGKEKLGFGLDERGAVFPFDSEGKRWLEMGAFDDLKKANQFTYQEILLRICRLRDDDFPIVLSLLPGEVETQRRFAEKYHLVSGRKVIGLYTGAGERWKMKCWTDEGFRELITLLLAETDYSIVLYGGPDASRRNADLYREFAYSKRLVSTGTDNPLRTFLALLSLSDLIVTGDTMALHAGLGLGKKVVGLFGPTSAAEIEMYGRGIKVTGKVDCLCCYRAHCTQSPTCMDTISPEMVLEAIRKLLK